MKASHIGVVLMLDSVGYKRGRIGARRLWIRSMLVLIVCLLESAYCSGKILFNYFVIAVEKIPGRRKSLCHRN